MDIKQVAKDDAIVLGDKFHVVYLYLGNICGDCKWKC